MARSTLELVDWAMHIVMKRNPYENSKTYIRYGFNIFSSFAI
jgi:hypothetical protein